jgi:hypothetical protein
LAPVAFVVLLGIKGCSESDDGPLSLRITSPTIEGTMETRVATQSLSGACSRSVAGIRTTAGTVTDGDCSDETWRVEAVPLAGGRNLVQVTGFDGQGSEKSDGLTFIYTPAAEPLVGEYHIGVILLDYVDDGTRQTRDQIEEAVLTGAFSLSNYIDQASYGRATLTGDVFDWVVLARPSSGFFPPDSQALDAVAAQSTLASYDGFLIIVHDPSAGFAVESSSGPITITTSQGEVNAGVARGLLTFYLPRDFSMTTQASVAWALTSSFNIPYLAHGYTCSGAVLAEDGKGCTYYPRGNLFSIMGDAGQASHPSAVTKERLDWLEADRVVMPLESGDFDLAPFESRSDAFQALKIPLVNRIPLASPVSGESLAVDYLYVEYRGLIGLDSRPPSYRVIRQSDGSDYVLDELHGALLHAADCSASDYCVPFLIDMHPSSMDPQYPPHELADAPLYAGEVFVVPDNPIEIEVIETVANDHITVRVTYR